MRLSLRKLMLIVACLGPVLIVVREVIWHYDATIYAAGYCEGRFRRIHVGMTAEEVESLMGPPLQMWTFSEAQDIEIWAYTIQGGSMDNYWRRWLYMQNNRVWAIDSEYYVD